MDPRPVVRKPDKAPQRRQRPAASGPQRGGSGEGARSALERLIEQEKDRRRSALLDEADDAPPGLKP